MSTSTNESSESSPAFVWDTYDIAKCQAQYLVESGQFENDDAAFNDACADSDLYQWQWEDLLDSLGEKLKEINPTGRWHAEVKNFGWRSQNGWNEFDADDAKTFLHKILPNTDCTFRIFIDPDKTLRLQNFHHDSPCGNEWYYIKAATEEEQAEAA